jgi:hypothetical protein
MSLSNTSFNTKRGPKGEVEPVIPVGGFVTYALPSGTSTTLLDTPTKGSTASHITLTNPASAVSTVNLLSTDVVKGTVKKIGLVPSGVSIAIASLTGGSIIYNGTTAVSSIVCVLASVSATVVLQYVGNKVWKLVEVNGTVTINV